jgi:hypothetical protein
MKSKEDYYLSVLENRKLAADPEVTKCPCTAHLCEWHGKCRECVALHRYHGDHVPACLQTMLRDKITALAAVAEMSAEPVEKTPDDYRLYVRERDASGG